MASSYLIVILTIFALSLLIDIFHTRLAKKYPTKLFIALFFIFGMLFLQVYIGISIGLWKYGKGILGIYFLSIPLEEYLYMAIAPYSAIVLWEAFHKLVRTQTKKRSKRGKK